MNSCFSIELAASLYLQWKAVKKIDLLCTVFTTVIVFFGTGKIKIVCMYIARNHSNTCQVKLLPCHRSEGNTFAYLIPVQTNDLYMNHFNNESLPLTLCPIFI